MTPDTAPTQAERSAAAAAHAGALTIPVVVALFIWRREREKSTYVRFQAQQALVYQSGLLALVILILASLASLFLAPFLSPLFLAGFSLAMFLMLILIAMNLLAVVAVFRADRGEDFCYPLIGRWLERRNRDRPGNRDRL